MEKEKTCTTKKKEKKKKTMKANNRRNITFTISLRIKWESKIQDRKNGWETIKDYFGLLRHGLTLIDQVVKASGTRRAKFKPAIASILASPTFLSVSGVIRICTAASDLSWRADQSMIV